MRLSSLTAKVGVLLALAGGMTGCGGGKNSSDAVIRVGADVVTAAAVAHWTAVMKAEHVSLNFPDETSREHAINFLVKSRWLIGEAAAEGMAVSVADVKQRFAERVKSYPGGLREYEEFLRLSGRTLQDAMLVTQAQTAADEIRAALAAREPAVTHAQLAAYYRRHAREFVLDEQRSVDVVGLHSAVAARKLRNELSSGDLSPKEADMESLEYGRGRGAKENGEKPLYDAIYAATPGKFAGPIKDESVYYIFRLNQILPPVQPSLGEVLQTVKKRQAAEQRRQRLAAFVAEWRRRWQPKTSCLATYVGRYCSQYTGSADLLHEDPFSIG